MGVRELENLGQHDGIVVRKCMDEETHEVYARKSILKKTLGTANATEDVLEVAIMKHLPAHPNIVALKKTVSDHKSVHLFMELCEGGTLFERILTKGRYTERGAAPLMRTIAEVVQTCHKHGVMHHDLTPKNLLFVNKCEDSPLKAIDFGASVFFKRGEKFTDIVGTPPYMAPEIWKGEYGPEVDVWSVGVILYFMLSGRIPFKPRKESLHGYMQEILYGTLDLERDPWPKVSNSAKSLLRHMLERDPKARYNAEQVLNHPWLREEGCMDHCNTKAKNMKLLSHILKVSSWLHLGSSGSNRRGHDEQGHIAAVRA
ncbi:hypothetical protein M758_1G144400 [Ceratodon purpureus]|nr:hypothetical protein M758_1G144400 [Ceratodon purpureus]